MGKQIFLFPGATEALTQYSARCRFAHPTSTYWLPNLCRELTSLKLILSVLGLWIAPLSSLEINCHYSWKKWTEDCSEMFFSPFSFYSYDLVSIDFSWLYSVILTISKLYAREFPFDNSESLRSRTPILPLSFGSLIMQIKDQLKRNTRPLQLPLTFPVTCSTYCLSPSFSEVRIWDYPPHSHCMYPTPSMNEVLF